MQDGERKKFVFKIEFKPERTSKQAKKLRDKQARSMFK